MAVDNYSRLYCINNLVTMVVETIRDTFPGLTNSVILEKFTKSKTYELLCDTRTGLWTEGPDYIIGFYQKEEENLFNLDRIIPEKGKQDSCIYPQKSVDK